MTGLTAAGLSAPVFVPASALARAGRPGANDRIQVGLIGAGGMGRANLRNCAKYADVVVTGVCDIWQARREQTVTNTSRRPKATWITGKCSLRKTWTR